MAQPRNLVVTLHKSGVDTLPGLGGALRAPLGPVVAPLVPRYALLPAPTPRMMGLRPPRTSRCGSDWPERVHYGGPTRARSSTCAQVTTSTRSENLDRSRSSNR